MRIKQTLLIYRVATRPRDVRGANLPLGTCQVSPGGVWDAGTVLSRRMPGLIPRQRRSPARWLCLHLPEDRMQLATWKLESSSPGPCQGSAGQQKPQQNKKPQQGGFVVKSLTLISESLSSSPSSGIIREEILQLFLIPSAKQKYHSQPHRAEI